MPALLELQRAMRRELLGDADIGEHLAIYRNTCIGALAGALRLSFPAVAKLVGEDFFEAAARQFIRAHAPEGAYLNDYGAEFPHFLAQFPAASTLPYLGDVAQLEWAVNRALHAADVPALDVSRLAALDGSLLSTVSFTAHPALTLLQLRSPADAIWQAVLDQDESAMAAIDLKGGPVCLLIERNSYGVQVRRMSSPAWQFTAQLSSGKPLFEAIETVSELQHGEIDALLADHLAQGRFIDFSWTGESLE